MPNSAANPRGFALLIVLWTLVLLSLLTTQIAIGARSETRVATNLRQQASLAAAADGVLYEALFHLLDPARGHWPADGTRHALALAGGSAEVALVNEAGRFGVNHATAPQLQALLLQLGAQPAAAQRLASAIVAWHTPDKDGVAAGAYKAAGLPYAPPGAPFQSLSELRLVVGMTPPLLASLLPHLSLAQPADPDPALADPLVRRALRAAADPTAAVSAAVAAAPTDIAVQVVCTAVDTAGARVTRRAEVVVTLAVAPGAVAGAMPFRIVDWSDDAGAPVAIPPTLQ